MFFMNTIQNKIKPFFPFESNGDPLLRLVDKIREKEDSIDSIKELIHQVLLENKAEFFPSEYWQEEIRPAILTENSAGSRVRTIVMHFLQGNLPGLTLEQKEDLVKVYHREHGVDLSERPQSNRCCVIS